MSVIYKFLFPSKPDGTAMSLLILALRILFGILLMSHGVQKWANYDVMSGSFPDPLGIGSQLSLVLAIFGEMVCSMAFIFGFLYRLAMLPMIFTMCIAFFVVHGSDPFAVKELAFIYLVVFILLYIAGPGKFSLDHFIAKALASHKKYLLPIFYKEVITYSWYVCGVQCLLPTAGADSWSVHYETAYYALPVL